MQLTKFIVLIYAAGFMVSACGQRQEAAPQVLASTVATEEDKETLKALALEACAEDREALCPGLKFGQGLIKCAKAHKAEISEGCKQFVKDHLAEFKAWRRR